MQRMIQDGMRGEYWLGVECYPAPPVLRAHLNLPENQGLVVAGVVPDSPAAKAGLETHDILMQAGEKKFATVQDLMQAVEAAKETPLNFEILRAGKAKAIDLMPAKRPQNMMFKQEGTPADWQQIMQWLEKSHAGAAAGQPQQFHFRVIQPGAILPPGAAVEPAMPNNMSININRNGDKPAQVMVRWNDQKWDITEKELDKLPPEVRPHVERMLGRTKFGMAGAQGALNADVLNFTIPAPPPGTPGAPGPQMQVQPFRTLEDRLEELNRKLDRLSQELHEHRGERQPPAPAEKDSPPAESEPAPSPEK
jgi:hypothetical protein